MSIRTHAGRVNPFIPGGERAGDNMAVLEQQPKIITIVVAEDHVLFRDAILEILGAEKTFRVVAQAGDGLAALKAIREHAPRVAVLDIEMPGLTGLEIARAILEEALITPIVLLTMHKEIEIVRKAQEFGVAGYVLKEDLDTHLVKAIQAAATWQTFISPLLPMPSRNDLRSASSEQPDTCHRGQ